MGTSPATSPVGKGPESKKESKSAVALPSIHRRVHNDGVVMLNHKKNLQEAEEANRILENRLKRLEFEKNRAEKNQNLA